MSVTAPNVRAGWAPRRAATTRALIVPTVRTLPWWQLAAGGVAAMIVVLSAHRLPELPLDHLVGGPLRLAIPLLAIGVAGALDDPTRPHLDGTPVPLWLRQSVRLVAALSATAAWWVGALLIAWLHPGAADGLPIIALSVELVGLVAVTLTVAGVATRRRGGSGTVVGGGAALALALVVGQLLPSRWLLPPYLPPPAGALADPLWLAAHLRVSAVTVLAVTLLAWVLRDPSRTHRWLHRAARPSSSLGPIAAREPLPHVDSSDG